MVGTYPPRVLIIEDDPVVRGAVQALLDYFGYESGLAADGPSGLRRFEGEPWDLVVTDLTLPGMSGWEVVDAIRGRAPTLPVILITGVDDPMVRTRARASHVLLLLKPFGLDALQAALSEAVYPEAP
jgi:two-component system capsular synthesis sensor histidine kinase RcsC